MAPCRTVETLRRVESDRRRSLNLSGPPVGIRVVTTPHRTSVLLATWLLAAGFLLLLSGCGSHKSVTSNSKATGARRATPHEIRDLTAALSNYRKAPLRIRFATISLSDPTYAAVSHRDCRTGCEVESDFLHRSGPSWTASPARHAAYDVLYVFISPDSPRDSACPYAPANVVHDLFGIKCPPEQALHARRANVKEAAALRAVFLSHDKIPPADAAQAQLGYVCISRLNPNWAGAHTHIGTSAGTTVFFHRKSGRWLLVYDSVAGRRPPHAILLSLESCVAYGV